MTQAALFAMPKPPKPPKPEPRIAQVQVRKPAVPFEESRDKAGRYWWERFRDELRELPADCQAVLTEIMIEWPAERGDKARLILDKWFRAGAAERDNFMEAMGQ